MSIVFLKEKLTREEFERAREDYQTYIKFTVDISSGVVVLGGEYHADAETILLSNGSKQDDIWGGGVNLETKGFETNAMVNLRAGKNESAEILDPVKRERFLTIVRATLVGFI